MKESMMKKDKPLILISNDDGVDAKGIRELIEYLRPLGELLVMAPDGARSGMSCAITADKPVRYKLLSTAEGLSVYKCSGTPSDCIKLALFLLDGQLPDLVVGGINHGDNSAINVHYSGTMGVVKEGCMKGIPSVGFSLCDHCADADFRPTAPYIRLISRQVLEKGLPAGTCLNVNFPEHAPYEGIKVCRQTVGKWDNEWVRYRHPAGKEYFWLTGEFVNHEPDEEETDQWALNHGYVAVTPTRIDVTDYDLLEEMRGWNLENTDK